MVPLRLEMDCRCPTRDAVALFHSSIRTRNKRRGGVLVHVGVRPTGVAGATNLNATSRAMGSVVVTRRRDLRSRGVGVGGAGVGLHAWLPAAERGRPLRRRRGGGRAPTGPVAYTTLTGSEREREKKGGGDGT